MAVTIRDICERALRKINVGGVDPSGRDMRDALDTYNAMIHAWNLQGVPNTHADQDFPDLFGFPSRYIEGTIYMLAGRLSDDFQAPPTFDADDFFRKLQADAMAVATIEDETPRSFIRMPSELRRKFWS